LSLGGNQQVWHRFMARKLAIPEKFRAPIALLARHADKVPMLAGVIEGMRPADRVPSKIAKQFSEGAAIPVTEARQIVNQLMAFHQLQSTVGMTPTEMYDEVLESLTLDASEEWKKDHLENFKKARRIIEEAASPSHPLYLVQKAMRLRYEHQNILYDSNVLVDVRPVFDIQGRELKQMTLGFKLEIEYNDGTERRHLFAALDALDIAKLKASCERAQTKTVTLTKALAAVNVPILVPGEMDDE
jgi:hypothetical protein